MTVPDRILAACSGDLEQAELVLSQLERVRLLREEGRRPRALTPSATPPSTLLPEQPHCSNCQLPFDESGFCQACGRLWEAPKGARVEEGRHV